MMDPQLMSSQLKSEVKMRMETHGLGISNLADLLYEKMGYGSSRSLHYKIGCFADGWIFGTCSEHPRKKQDAVEDLSILLEHLFVPEDHIIIPHLAFLYAQHDLVFLYPADNRILYVPYAQRELRRCKR
jgi:hypothetical protein